MLFDEAGRPNDYRFLEANPAFVKQTGLEDAVGRRMRELAPGHEEHWFEVYGTVAINGEPVRFDARADALNRWYDVYAFRIGQADEHKVAILFDDVSSARAAALERERLLAESERMRAEAEAARADAEAANRAKSEFLAVMSHELRTPLNAIDGYAELMELGIRGPLTPEQRKDLGRIRHSQRHLLGLINGVLNYSRVEAGAVRYDIEDVPLDEVLATCEALTAPQRRAKKLDFRYDGCDTALRARADGEKLQQIVLNLLTNAMKFTEPGGRVELDCTLDGDTVGITVTDTGRGIAAEHLERVFEPFVQVDTSRTRTHEGVGLGLAISRDLARGMGGDIVAESTKGVGSTFTLTLPAASA
jgi:signal transduction histidine kinase